jgi:Zn-dependent protease
VIEVKWSWRLGKVAGIEIRVHVTFLFALAWGAFIWGGGRLSGLPYGAALTVALFTVVVLHELGHSLAAKRYGILVHDIVLLPIGGVARLARMPDKPAQELVVALAGPAVNLAFLIATAPVVLGTSLRQTVASGVLGLGDLARPGLWGFAAFIMVTNAWLLIFNLLPAFPMDGGRVLRALLALRLSYVQATMIASLVGRGFAVLFGIYGILTANFMLVLIALFVFNGAAIENQETSYRERMRGATVTDVIDSSAPTLSSDLPAHVAFDRLLRSPYRALAVVDGDGQFIGLVSRQALQSRWTEGVRGLVSNFVDRPSLVLECSTPLDVARERMAETQTPVAAVYCGGEFAGLLDFATIARFLALRRQASNWNSSSSAVTGKA